MRIGQYDSRLGGAPRVTTFTPRVVCARIEGRTTRDGADLWAVFVDGLCIASGPRAAMDRIATREGKR